MKEISKLKVAALSCTTLLAVVISSCGNSETKTATTNDSTTVKPLTAEEMNGSKELKPAGPKPDWAPSIKDEMAVVMEKLASFKAPPIETLTPAQARQQPSPATAVAGVMADYNITPPPPQVDSMDKDLGGIAARIYTPKSGTAPYPVIVYYHGGGWVIADLNTYAASARGLAEQTGAVVVSVEYRKGPEAKFPAAHNDAFAAYQWVLQNASSIKVDPKRIAVAGESAGGNLACNVSIMARDKGIQLPLYQVLVYPVANNDMNSESYTKYAAAKPLNKPMMEWFAKNYLPNMDAAADPRISLVRANLKGLPPTTIIGAEIDPLMTEGKLLSDKLKEAGVTVNYKLYEGVTHEFFGMAAVVPQAKEAQGVAASDLKGALNK